MAPLTPLMHPAPMAPMAPPRADGTNGGTTGAPGAAGATGTTATGSSGTILCVLIITTTADAVTIPAATILTLLGVRATILRMLATTCVECEAMRSHCYKFEQNFEIEKPRNVKFTSDIYQIWFI